MASVDDLLKIARSGVLPDRAFFCKKDACSKFWACIDDAGRKWEFCMVRKIGRAEEYKNLETLVKCPK